MESPADAPSAPRPHGSAPSTWRTPWAPSLVQVRRLHAFDVIPEQELLRWRDELPDVYPIAAAGIAAIRQVKDRPHWTDIALKFLDKSPDRVRVLQKFIRQFSLPGWDLSRAAEVQANLQLLDDFAGNPDPTLADFAKSEKSRLSQAIADARKVRPPIYMERDEGSFE
jgi:hypothetical protein